MQATAVAMNRITLEEIRKIGAAEGPWLTILMPLTVTPRETGQNAIRLRRAIEAAELQFAEKGVSAEHSQRMLEPLRQLTEERNWGTDQGLALFCASDVFRAYLLSKPLPSVVSVAEHVHITPLLAHMNGHGAFYVVTLSQKNVRLLRCNESECEEIPLPAGIPKSLADDSQTEQPDHDLTNSITAGPSHGAMRGVMFTTSTDREGKDEYLLKFYKHVSEGLHELFKEEGVPVVAAGVDYELALFRRVNVYPNLVEEAVHGALSGFKNGELHRRALEAVQSHRETPLRKALARFQQYERRNRTSTTMKEIVKAAWDGRIEDLFLAEGAQYMGKFDEATDRVRRHAVRGEEDLLNAAAMRTILHSGDVFVVPAGKVPRSAPAAASFRY